MHVKLTGDVVVPHFELDVGGERNRIDFPHAKMDDMEGVAGVTGAAKWHVDQLLTEGLFTWLGSTHWQASLAAISGARVGDLTSRFIASAATIEMPRGFLCTRGADGLELITPELTLAGIALRATGPFGGEGDEVTAQYSSSIAAAIPTLRQKQLLFLDGVSGEIRVTIKVELDLPLLGTRTLDQKLVVPIKDGMLDFRALDKSLNWLEGAFLDISVEDDRLAVSWGVPIVMSSREIISWPLDEKARMVAKLGSVPLRSLFDFRIGAGNGDVSDGKPTNKPPKKSILRSLTLADINIRLSMLAPRSADAFGGAILFGSDEGPGIVGLEVAGSITDRDEPGALRGKIGLVDTTAKDIKIGGAKLTVDRLSMSAIDNLQFDFHSFTPTQFSAAIERISASNLKIVI